MGSTEVLRVDSLCKQKGGKSYWGNPRKILRVAKRRFPRRDTHYVVYQEYFVVGVGDAVGFGCWLPHTELRALNALELLAMQLDA